MVASHSTSSLYPLSFLLSYRKLSPSYHSAILSVTQKVQPKSCTEASKDPNWIQGMNAQIQALEANHTWTLTNLPPHKTVIGCK